MQVDLRNNMISNLSVKPAFLYAILGFYKGDHGVIVGKSWDSITGSWPGVL